MATSELLDMLKNASGPSRQIDIELGLFAGWKRQVGGDGKVRKIQWVYPGDGSTKLPFFTATIEGANSLVKAVARDVAVGVKWDQKGRGVAVLGNGPQCAAATPAIALCVAAVYYKVAHTKS